MHDKLKVLIVDDSMVFRKALEQILSSIEQVEVVGSVWNGVKAIEFIKNEQHPHLVTLDLEMPEMDGLQTLKEIQKINKQNPAKRKIDVLMISAYTQSGAVKTIEALQNGAYDFITKPISDKVEDNFQFLHKAIFDKILIIKVKRNLSEGNSIFAVSREKAIIVTHKSIDAIAIGISTGGPTALNESLPQICEITHLPIFIVQHIPREFTKSFASNLNSKCKHHVVEATDNMIVENRKVYVAPGGLHMTLKRTNLGVQIMLNDGPRVNNCKPSVDVLFKSFAEVYGSRCIAVIMTGIGNDGSKNLPLLKSAGTTIIAQDKESSAIWGMPGSAVRTGCVDYIVALNSIHSIINKIINRPL